MKTKKYLFFLSCFTILFAQNLLAQVSNDSLNYYTSKVDKGTAEVTEMARAYVIFDEEKEKNLNKGDVVRAVYYLDKMSSIENELGLFYDSESTVVEGLALLDKLTINKYNNRLRNRLVNRIGMILWEYEDYKEPLKYFFDLLKIVQRKSDSATIYNNIGISYKYQQKYDSARVYLKKAYNLSKEIGKKHPILSKSLDNLGFVQGMLNIEEGLLNMEKALEIRKLESGDIYQSYKHLTDFYTLKKNKTKALFYAQKAYDIALNHKSESNIVDISRSFLDLGEHSYLDEYLVLSDKISLEKKLNENKFSKVKYDYEKSEQERRKSDLQLEKEKSKKIIYSSLGILAVLVLIGLIIILRIRHKKNVLIKQFETEQYISKKLHDEVANDVFHTMTKVKGDSSSQSELLDALDGVYHKVRDISKANTDLDVTRDFGRLLNDLIFSYKTEHVNIFTKNASKIVWSEVSEAKRKILYRVLQELMINMKKHSKANLVTLNFEKDKRKIQVKYVDNGVGCRLEKGSGLRNTESRMEMVGGVISFESEIDKGFRVNLTL